MKRVVAAVIAPSPIASPVAASVAQPGERPCDC